MPSRSQPKHPLYCQPISNKIPSIPPPPIRTEEDSTRAASRKGRVYILYQFLRSTYPQLFNDDGIIDRNFHDSRQNRRIILDVAGGKGDLSWLICNLHPYIHSVVVDPRGSTNHSSLLKSVKFLEENPLVARERSIEGRPTYQPLASFLPKLLKMNDSCFETKCDAQSSIENADASQVESSTSRRWRSAGNLGIHFDDRLVTAIEVCTTSKQGSKTHLCSGDPWQSWNDYWNDALLRSNHSIYRCNNLSRDSSSELIRTAADAWNLVANTEFIVGFHPDQATEAIIDLALKMDICFCIVPCCVFPSEFPDRVWNGERVRDYHTFISYLKAKDDRIQEATLDFPYTKTARNIALYTLPDKDEMN